MTDPDPLAELLAEPILTPRVTDDGRIEYTTEVRNDHE